MRLNKAAKATPLFTHEGGPAYPHLTPIQQLRRSVLACLLWEDTFYENGHSIADRITGLANQVSPDELAALAIAARLDYKLRHAPLLLLDALTVTGSGIPALVKNTIARVINRADELAEFLAIYFRNGRKPIAAQMKKGLALAFAKFDSYQIAKYDRKGAVRIRDVLRLVHPKPENESRETLYANLSANALASPDTWEVALSAGDDKRETFTRLITDGKLGYMALLRNLRNMDQSGVDADLIEGAILARRGAHNVLPFRYISAARAVPRFEQSLNTALLTAISDQPKLTGNTMILVDCSASMDCRLSDKSQVTRLDAASALAGCFHGKARLLAYSTWCKEVPFRPGLACVDVLKHAGPHGGTMTGDAVRDANEFGYDRIILITDEQSADAIPDPLTPLAYCINVGTDKNGIGYGKWVHIDGFSEAALRYIHGYEQYLLGGKS